MLIFPILFTERLKLRKLEVDDFASLVKYANNKKISDRIINIPHPYREPVAAFRMSYVVQGFKNKSRFVFAITQKEEGELIGEISLHLNQASKTSELGYWLAEPYWGKGLITEAIEAVLNFGFERLELEKIFATCHVDNIASGKVLEKNGFLEKNVNGNVQLFELTKPEYED